MQPKELRYWFCQGTLFPKHCAHTLLCERICTWFCIDPVWVLRLSIFWFPVSTVDGKTANLAWGIALCRSVSTCSRRIKELCVQCGGFFLKKTLLWSPKASDIRAVHQSLRVLHEGVGLKQGFGIVFIQQTFDCERGEVYTKLLHTPSFYCAHLLIGQI